MDLFSTLFFWYLFAMTGYWFVFFKLQSNVYCFLPSLDDWFPYYDYTCISESWRAAKYSLYFTKLFMSNVPTTFS